MIPRDGDRSSPGPGGVSARVVQADEIGEGPGEGNRKGEGPKPRAPPGQFPRLPPERGRKKE